MRWPIAPSNFPIFALICCFYLYCCRTYYLCHKHTHQHWKMKFGDWSAAINRMDKIAVTLKHYCTLVWGVQEKEKTHKIISQFSSQLYSPYQQHQQDCVSHHLHAHMWGPRAYPSTSQKVNTALPQPQVHVQTSTCTGTFAGKLYPTSDHLQQNFSKGIK